MMTEPVPIARLPLTLTSPPKTARLSFSPPAPIDPDTKNDTFEPGRDGKDDPGTLANITLPVIPIREALLADPEILFAISAMESPSPNLRFNQ